MSRPKLFTITCSLVLMLFLAAVSPAMAQSTPPPPQTAPGGMPNIWYGGVPPNGTQAPVLVFVHGMGTNATFWWNGNDMYTDAYNAGYRTAFVSLSLDNSNNSESINTNGAMLQKQFPEIAAHYGVTKFYAICHSKGGVDAQDAMMDPTTAGYVKAMFNLATPQSGSPLANWAYGAGAPIAKLLGLNSPALFDLQTQNMAVFRNDVNPTLQALNIPIYTMEGTDSKAGNNPFLVLTGKILSNLDPNEPNDGLVPLSYALLPDAMAMDLAQLPHNHIEMGTGSVVWPYLQGQIQGLVISESGWNRVATGGFGDDNNTWAWSMKWYKNRLYVGTGRDVTCVIYATSDVQQGTKFYPPAGSNCTPDMKDLPLRAEIWAYTPQTQTWQRVYQSPNDIPIGTDSAGNHVNTAEDVGFRGMAVFTEPNGVQALYVGGVGANSLFGSLPQYAGNNYPAPHIMRTTDGINFAPIPAAPGTFMGNIIKNNTDINVVGFRSLEVYKGMLFATASDYRGQGFIINSTQPWLGNNAWQRVSGNAQTLPVWTLQVYNNFLYCATGTRTGTNGYGLYKTDATGPAPYQYTAIITQGGGQPNADLRSDVGLSLGVLNNLLYMGTDRKIELLRIYPDDTWEILAGEPRPQPVQGLRSLYPVTGMGQAFGNQFNGHFWKMGLNSQGLHVSTWDWSISLGSQIAGLGAIFNSQFGFDMYRTTDGNHWSFVNKTGMGDGYNFGGRTWENTPFGLFVGTARPTGGLQVFLNPMTLDLNNDGVIDSLDVNLIMGHLNQPASANDPRDLDQDGKITVLDARLLSGMCTFPGCMSGPKSVVRTSTTTTLSPPVVTSANGVPALGATVTLSWAPVTGAAAYRIFRWTGTPLLDFFPPGGITIDIPVIGPVTIPQDILNGKLNFLCSPILSGTPLCFLDEFVKQAGSAPNYIGLPAALKEVGRVTNVTSWSEPNGAPTPMQSIYFVEAEDAQGNVSDPSNIVGGPSMGGAPQ